MSFPFNLAKTAFADKAMMSHFIVPLKNNAIGIMTASAKTKWKKAFILIPPTFLLELTWIFQSVCKDYHIQYIYIVFLL